VFEKYDCQMWVGVKYPIVANQCNHSFYLKKNLFVVGRFFKLILIITIIKSIR